MNIQDIIWNLKAECAGCKVQKAIEALQALDSGAEKTTKAHKSLLKTKKVHRSGNDSDPKTRTEKACTKCGAVKKLVEYPTNKACADGHVGECKECCRKRQRDNWRRKHGKPVEDENGGYNVEAIGDPIVCKLCKSVCRDQKRYESHMRAVHGMQAA